MCVARRSDSCILLRNPDVYHENKDKTFIFSVPLWYLLMRCRKLFLKVSSDRTSHLHSNTSLFKSTLPSLTSAAPSAAFFSPQPSLAQRSAVLRSSVMKKLSKKMSEVMDQSSSPRALKGVILNGCRSSKNAGLAIFLGFQTPWQHKLAFSCVCSLFFSFVKRS